MADVAPIGTLTGPGQSNGTGDRTTLLLKQFGGEVIAEFEQAFKLRPLHLVKSLAPGRKADTFPVLGKALSAYHQVGNNILVDEDSAGTDYLQNIKAAERLIYADREAVSPVFVDKLEEMLAHWDVRNQYAKQLAVALAKRADQNCIRSLAIAARQAATFTGAQVGAYVNGGKYALGGVAGGAAVADATIGGIEGTELTGTVFASTVAWARRYMNDNDVPLDDRYLLVSPSTVYLLLNGAAGRDFVHKDYLPAGNGGLVEGTVGKMHGFTVIETSNFPTDNYTATDNQPGGSGNSYVVDMSSSATRAIAFHRSALGSVVASDIGIETEYKMEYRGNLVIASYVMGHAPLRPGAVVEIAKNIKP
jgi:hypothetical protein